MLSPRAVPFAMALRRPKEPLQRLELSALQPQSDEVVVRVEACGLGLSDWDVAMLDALPHTPLVLGREAVGHIEQLGPDVTSCQVGQRVGITPIAGSCGQCEHCLQGALHRCEQLAIHGLHRNGALATHVAVSAQHLVPLSDELSAAQCAVLLGTGWSAMNAARAAVKKPHERIGVFGIGGLGHLVVQLIRELEAVPVAVELDRARKDLAVELGAVLDEPAQLDAAVVCTPSIQAIARAHAALKPGGRLVLAADSPTGRLDLSLHATVARGITIEGVRLGPKRALEELLGLYARGQLKPVVTTAPLEQAGEWLYRLRDGGYLGRLVLLPPA